MGFFCFSLGREGRVSTQERLSLAKVGRVSILRGPGLRRAVVAKERISGKGEWSSVFLRCSAVRFATREFLLFFLGKEYPCCNAGEAFMGKGGPCINAPGPRPAPGSRCKGRDFRKRGVEQRFLRCSAVRFATREFLLFFLGKE